MLSIHDFGAVPNTAILQTAPIQAALDAAKSAGGGTVRIPAGRYISGTLQMYSNTHLILEAGAVLQASGDLADYPHVPFHHSEFIITQSLLWAIDAEQISISGPGTIDLHDTPFIDWNTPRFGDKYTVDDHAKLSPDLQAEVNATKKPRPSQPIFFHHCRDLLFDAVRIINAPCWAVSISSSSRITVRNVLMDNHLRAPNSDGFHFSSCSQVLVSGCIMSCGDDCLAFTGICDFDGITEHIHVHDCVLRSRSSGVRFGHLASKVRNVNVHDLTIYDSTRGIILSAGEGGWIENVRIHDVSVETRIIAGNWWGNGEPLVLSAIESAAARIDNVRVRNLTARSESPIILYGRDGNITRVSLESCEIALSPSLLRAALGDRIDLRPGPVLPGSADPGHYPWLWAHEVKGLRLSGNSIGAVDPAIQSTAPVMLGVELAD